MQDWLDTTDLWSPWYDEWLKDILFAMAHREASRVAPGPVSRLDDLVLSRRPRPALLLYRPRSAL